MKPIKRCELQQDVKNLLKEIGMFLFAVSSQCKECTFKKGESYHCERCWSPRSAVLHGKVDAVLDADMHSKDEELQKEIVARIEKSAPNMVRATDIHLRGATAEHRDELLKRLVLANVLDVHRTFVGNHSAYAYTIHGGYV